MKSYDVRSQIFEIIGLLLLLIAFGVQCFVSNRQDAKYRSFAYVINQQLFSIHSLVYNDALKQDYYKGDSQFKIDEGSYHPSNYDWNRIAETNEKLGKETSISFTINALLYVIGSALVILGKWIKLKQIKDKKYN